MHQETFQKSTRIAAAVALPIIGFAICWQPTPAMGQEQPIDQQAFDQRGAGTESYEELTRGPLHEAFAEQVSLEPQPGIVVPKQPPEPINELPPENRPADENAVWIGGYWAFSDVGHKDEDFIWVSGVWRVPPRGNQWVPGYWTKTDAGYQWIGGFWSSNERDDVAYLPEPPKTLEEGPSSPAPSESHFWVPGCWRYQNNDYAWRPGYWAAAHDRYVWVPEYYRWSPSGYIHCGGYWDHPLTSRGYLFSPVHFRQPVYKNRSFSYRPNVVVDLGLLNFHLFVRPSYSHYYYGDYYGDRYTNNGFYAWTNYASRPQFYDPLFTYNVIRYRQRGIDFRDRISRWHNWFDEHEDMRPRHTFAQQRQFAEKYRDRDDIKTVYLGKSYSDVVRDDRNRFSQIDDRSQRDIDSLRERFTQMRQERERTERGFAGDDVGQVGDARDQRDNRDNTDQAQDQRNDRRFDLRRFSGRDNDTVDRDTVRSLRPNFDRDDRRTGDTNRPTDQGTIRDRSTDDIRSRIGGEGAPSRTGDGTTQPPATQPRLDVPRGDQRGDQAPADRGQAVPNDSPAPPAASPDGASDRDTGARRVDGPRFDDSPRIRQDQPENKPAPGGLVRPSVNPRGENRFSPPPDKSKFLPTPGSVRPGDNVPDNSQQGADVKGGGDYGTQPPSPAVTPSGTRQLPFGQRRDAASPQPDRRPAVEGKTPAIRPQVTPQPSKGTQSQERSQPSIRGNQKSQGSQTPSFRASPRSQPQGSQPSASKGGQSNRGSSNAKPSGGSNAKSQGKKSKD